jgi:hypothetical protein
VVASHRVPSINSRNNSELSLTIHVHYTGQFYTVKKVEGKQANLFYSVHAININSSFVLFLIQSQFDILIMSHEYIKNNFLKKLFVINQNFSHIELFLEWITHNELCLDWTTRDELFREWTIRDELYSGNDLFLSD